MQSTPVYLAREWAVPPAGKERQAFRKEIIEGANDGMQQLYTAFGWCVHLFMYDNVRHGVHSLARRTAEIDLSRTDHVRTVIAQRDGINEFCTRNNWLRLPVPTNPINTSGFALESQYHEYRFNCSVRLNTSTSIVFRD